LFSSSDKPEKGCGVLARPIVEPLRSVVHSRSERRLPRGSAIHRGIEMTTTLVPAMLGIVAPLTTVGWLLFFH
jgi:hypothetical protein